MRIHVQSLCLFNYSNSFSVLFHLDIGKCSKDKLFMCFSAKRHLLVQAVLHLSYARVAATALQL